MYIYIKIRNVLVFDDGFVKYYNINDVLIVLKILITVNKLFTCAFYHTLPCIHAGKGRKSC